METALGKKGRITYVCSSRDEIFVCLFPQVKEERDLLKDRQCVCVCEKGWLVIQECRGRERERERACFVLSSDFSIFILFFKIYIEVATSIVASIPNFLRLFC